MLTQAQEIKVQNMLDNLNDLKVKAHMLESQYAKGRQLDESGNDIAQAIEDLRSEQLSITEKLSDMFQDNEMKQMANKLKSYRFDQANTLHYLKEIAKDISELYAKAFKLMLENMKRRKKQEDAVETSEQLNEQEKIAHLSAKTKQYDEQKADRRLGEFQRGLTASPEISQRGVSELLGLKNSRKSRLNNNLVPKQKNERKPQITKNGQRKRGSSKLVYVKSSDAKAKEIAAEKALIKHDLEMTRDALANVPSQMSRG